MVSVDPLKEPGLPLERLDPSHFWHGIDASLADRWSIGSWPFLFLLPGGRLRPTGLVLLHLRCQARLGVHCAVDHSAGLLPLRKPERTGFSQSTDSGWSSIPEN